MGGQVLEIKASLVKELRERTGAPMMDCKQALTEAGGDIEKAIEVLREKGITKAAKKAGRTTAEGIVEAYIHGGGRIGVLIEVNCETDFVAKTGDFKTLCRDLAMQVAASRPEYVSREEIPAERIEKEKEILRIQALNEGRPEKMVDKIVAGRLDKFYQEVCLLDQPFVKDLDRSVKDIITEAITRLGENIVVRRFTRYQLGET
ncbi:MAG: translation elongation factor Ts [Clostridia bacterium]|nr:MAG: translation elongation factor Ts [Clostridia bacterium]